jgi:hypothetical protein
MRSSLALGHRLDELVHSLGDSTLSENRRAVCTREFKKLYERWMRLRAAEGDGFALSLGYTAQGWSFENWRKHAKVCQPA